MGRVDGEVLELGGLCFLAKTMAAGFANNVASVDRDAPPPSGHPCEACGCPVEPLDKFCPACGTPNSAAAVGAGAGTGAGARAGAGVRGQAGTDSRGEQGQTYQDVVKAEPVSQKFFRCQNCGSEVATDPDQRSYVCPFCDS